MVYKSWRIRAAGFALTAGLALLLAACGGGGEKESDGEGGGAGGPASFEVTMTDNAFTPNEFTISEGAEVTFNLTNEGAAPHNMRVASDGGDDNTVSEPALIPGGESGALTWDATGQSGEVKIVCDYHPQDMTATINVQ